MRKAKSADHIATINLEQRLKEELVKLKKPCNKCSSSRPKERDKLHISMPFELDIDHLGYTDIGHILSWIRSLNICELDQLNIKQKAGQDFRDDEAISILLTYSPCLTQIVH